MRSRSALSSPRPADGCLATPPLGRPAGGSAKSSTGTGSTGGHEARLCPFPPRAGGARPPAPSERDRWLGERYRLLLEGFNYQQKNERLADAGIGFVRAAGDLRVLEKIGRYFGRDAWEAFVLAVEVAAVDDPDGPPAGPARTSSGTAGRGPWRPGGCATGTDSPSV